MTSAHPLACPERLTIVGAGRLGNALDRALRDAGIAVDGPLGRGARATGAETVLLCVPDEEIASAAAQIEPGPTVGHCSGASDLDLLAPHPAFSLHPLMTFTADGVLPPLAGAGAAIDGSTQETLEVARSVAGALGMTPIRLAATDRAAYHAAASIASNFLVTLEAASERLAATAGVTREQLLPLVRATVENWARVGPERALTGPVARGDELTVERQRATVADRTPDLLGLFDTLVAATRTLADREVAVS